MTGQYNNTTTILCIYVLPVSSVGVCRHGLDTHWTRTHNSHTVAIPPPGEKEIGQIPEKNLRNPDSGIWIQEINFLKKYKKKPSFFVLVLVWSRWQI